MRVRFMKGGMTSTWGRGNHRLHSEEIVGVESWHPREFSTLNEANEYARYFWGDSAFCVEVPEPEQKTPFPDKSWFESKIESEKDMEIGAGTPKPQDDLADRLGQIIFRIETNFTGFSTAKTKSREERNLAILADIEKLKELKKELETP